MMKRAKKLVVQKTKDEDLDRFAGSSDEEKEQQLKIPSAQPTETSDSDGETENDNSDHSVAGIDDGFHRGKKNINNEGRNQTVGNDDDDTSSSEGEESDMGTKMAHAMSKILETSSASKSKKGSFSSSVVLAKTVTPLQKLQQKEKEERKAMKEKRQANRERKLSALHLPLSIATTNTIDSGGKISVAKELEQERFHRRVATRGVVALFNAITQHQRNTAENIDDSNLPSKKKEMSKVTKLGFLDKIKAAAKTNEGDEPAKTEKSERGKNIEKDQGANRSSWGALQDDYMLNSKKNWDEESSEDEASDLLDSEAGTATEVPMSRKKRRVSNNQ
mmetsp:Transcript_13510/g.31761  ORF Transcript_13510/g.31761 Transcript_13510/m.31761 type:complete len:333 (-) Transcript_13510:266-1264(-)